MRVQVLLLLLGMAGVTFLPRFIPLALFTRWRLPDRVIRLLHYMPTAVMAAIVFPLLFSSADGKLDLEPKTLLAALPVLLFAVRTKNLWASVLVGMLVYWLLGLAIR